MKKQRHQTCQEQAFTTKLVSKHADVFYVVSVLTTCKWCLFSLTRSFLDLAATQAVLIYCNIRKYVDGVNVPQRWPSNCLVVINLQQVADCKADANKLVVYLKPGNNKDMPTWNHFRWVKHMHGLCMVKMKAFVFDPAQDVECNPTNHKPGHVSSRRLQQFWLLHRQLRVSITFGTGSIMLFSEC